MAGCGTRERTRMPTLEGPSNRDAIDPNRSIFNYQFDIGNAGEPRRGERILLIDFSESSQTYDANNAADTIVCCASQEWKNDKELRRIDVV